MIHQARRIADARDLGSPVRNRLLFDFITTGFWTTQALGIRRLDEGEAKDPSRQIISLHRLVEDIERHRELFTREIYVGYDGAPFDYRAREEEEEKLLAAAAIAGGGSANSSAEVPAGGPDALTVAKDAHEAFDRLAKVEPGARQRSDRIPCDVFARPKELLSEGTIKKVKRLCNKRIAHAADPHSRGGDLPPDIRFREFERAHRTLIVASSFISAWILFDQRIEPVPDLHPTDWSGFLDSGGLDDCALTMLDDVAERLTGMRKRWSEKADRFLLGFKPRTHAEMSLQQDWEWACNRPAPPARERAARRRRGERRVDRGPPKR